MQHTFAKQNFVHIIAETEGSVMLSIYIPCYTVRVHELFLCRKKSFAERGDPNYNGNCFLKWCLGLKP